MTDLPERLTRAAETATTETPRERPIIFSGPMVRAILDGRKTQTRRVVKPQPPADRPRHCWWDAPIYGWTWDTEPTADWFKVKSPYAVGMRLWVRETWQMMYATPDTWMGGSEVEEDWGPIPERPDGRWADYAADGHDGPFRPSIHMPRWASRITLEITDVRVERVRDISRDDAFAEGVDRVDPYETNSELPPGMPACFRNYQTDGWFAGDPVASFRTLWDSINGNRPGCSWADNPWVWVVSFRRIQP